MELENYARHNTAHLTGQTFQYLKLVFGQKLPSRKVHCRKGNYSALKSTGKPLQLHFNY